jgi:hypothetical protein
MTEENSNEAIAKAVEGAELTRDKSLPVYMRRRGELIMVGSGVVTRHKDKTEVVMVLDTEDGLEMGSLLTSGIAQGLTLGGAVKPALVSKLN